MVLQTRVGWTLTRANGCQRLGATPAGVGVLELLLCAFPGRKVPRRARPLPPTTLPDTGVLVKSCLLLRVFDTQSLSAIGKVLLMQASLQFSVALACLLCRTRVPAVRTSSPGREEFSGQHKDHGSSLLKKHLEGITCYL